MRALRSFAVFTFALTATACRQPDLKPVEGLPDAGPIELTSRGTDFWLAYMENLPLEANGPPRFSLFIDAPTTINGQWESLNAIGGTFSVASSEQEVRLDVPVPYDLGSEVVGNWGLHVTTDRPIGLSAAHFRLYFTDSSLVLPTSMLGTEYVVLAITDAFKVSAEASRSEFIIVATDECTVTITPSVTTSGGHMAGVPFPVELHQGQTFQVQSPQDLSGTRVISTKPIAVFGGATQTSVECASADSHVWDELLPTRLWGTRTTVVPYLEQAPSPVKVVANVETDVRFGCGSAPVHLRAGEAVTQLLDAPTVISSTEPVLVAQLGKSRDCTPKQRGDPTLAVRMPDALWGRQHRLQPLLENASRFAEQRVANAAWVSVTMQGPGRLLVDGVNRNDALTALGPNFVGEVPLSEGPHRIEATAPITGIHYGLGDYDAYSQALGVECASCLAKLRTLTCDE